MVSKDDKDGQIVFLREALKKIQDEAKQAIDDWSARVLFDKIEHIASTALLDTTF